MKDIIFEGSRVRIAGALPIISASNEKTEVYSDDHTEKGAAVIAGIATTMADSHARNPASVDARIEPTMGYRDGHNSVTEVFFEVSQNLPQPPLPFKQQFDVEYLRELIKRDPKCTLKQLCDWVQEETGITLSKTAMCRLVKGYHLQRQRSHRSHVYPSRSLTLAA